MSLLTPEEVSDRLRCTTWFVRRELNAGHLRGSKVAGHWRVPEEAIEEYLTARSNIAAAPTPVRRRRRRVS